MLVWVPGGVSDVLATRVSEVPEVVNLTEVLGGTLQLVSSETAAGELMTQTRDGRSIPLDTLAYDTETFRFFAEPATVEALDALGDGDAILGATSARLRGIDVGGTLTLMTGHSLTVRAVLADDLIAAAEVIVSPSAAKDLGVDTRRFLLADHVQRPAKAVALIKSVGSPVDQLRVVAAGDTRWLRHGDQVSPQSLVKDFFGEFSARPAEGELLSVDPGWVDANIVTEAVPLLGEVTCHRLIIEPLGQALGELERTGQSDTIEPGGYSGCYYPRAIAGLPYVSRHSWGIALDLNIHSDERGRDVEFDLELVEAMSRAGFTSGADWPFPDPAHFEYVVPVGDLPG